jgi:signal transduction histidine kinase
MLSYQEVAQLDLIESPVFVLEITAEGDPVYAAMNRFALETSKRPLWHFLGRNALEVYKGAFGKSAYDRHHQVMREREMISYDIGLPLGGEHRLVRTTLSPVLNKDGDVALIYGTSFDITAERTAAQLQASLETLTLEVEQFVSMAAHDLRTPMRNVSVLADMLRDGFEDRGDGKLELINMLEDVAGKAMGLITDVLAHANATNTDAKVRSFEFGDLCQEICDVLDPMGHGTYRFSRTALTADHAALQIALRNVIENAIKNQTSDTLELDITLTQHSDTQLHVRLHDNGDGFSDAALAFLDSGTLRVDSGYGLLGVRRLIMARGGMITAFNDPSKGGGVVEFTLPGTLDLHSTARPRKAAGVA